MLLFQSNEKEEGAAKKAVDAVSEKEVARLKDGEYKSQCPKTKPAPYLSCYLSFLFLFLTLRGYKVEYIYLWSKYDLDKSIIHSRFNPTGVRTHGI